MNESVKYENAVRRLTVDDIIARERACGVFGPFSQQRWLARAPQHIKDHLSRARKFPGVYGASQGFGTMVGNPVYPPSSFTPITASATETNFWTPAIWTPIPANDMTAGKGYHVKCGGIFTSTGTQGLLTFTPRCGQSSTPSSNITLGASNVTAPPASLTSQAWYAEFTMTIRALGLAASGATGTGNGFAFVQGAAAATGIVYVMGGAVPTTIDNTAATGLIISLTISVASQSYTCQWCRLVSEN